MTPRKTLPEFLGPRILVTETCWLWTGGKNEHGYGVVGYNYTTRKAHRVIYELFVGPIPDGLVIDHLCRNPPCVNPAHLEPVTNAENQRRGNSGKWESAKTHCPKNHPYSGDNLVYDGKKRKCRTCLNANFRTRYAKNPYKRVT